jgi:hypothetical protein
MNFKCLLTGHNGFAPTGHTYKVLDYETGEYEFRCLNCQKTINKNNKAITDVMKGQEERLLVNTAWLALITNFPLSHSGKNKHSITYNWDGSIFFTVDLKAEEITALRVILNTRSQLFNNWQVRPLLQVAK